MAQPQIYFQCQVPIASIPYNLNIKISEIQTYVAEKLQTTDFILTIDNQRFSYSDMRTLQQLQIPPDQILQIMPPCQTINILFKKGVQEITFQNFEAPDTTFLNQIINQFQQSLTQEEIQTLDKIYIINQQGNRHTIDQFDQTQQLFVYFGHLSQIIICATQNLQIIREKIIQQRITIGQQQLKSLVILKNVSLIIDEEEKVVSYKFHLPQMVQGFLYEEKGKSLEKIKNFKPLEVDWVEKTKLKYTELPDGFAIAWENGTINSVSIITM